MKPPIAAIVRALALAGALVYAPASASVPAAAPLVSADFVAGSLAGPVAAPEDETAAVQAVIARGNDAQAQAIASGDPAIMAGTSTSRYYQELVRVNQELLDHGVTGIKLVKLEWGPVQVNGATATATAYETWRTTYADGVTDEARDRNVYTLVRSGATWRIDADDHPDDAPPPDGAPGRGTTLPAPPDGRVPPAQPPADRNTSTNWSGYTAGGGSFTAVSGTWTVPHVGPDGSFGAGATWVGIGGVRVRDLIQAGTQELVTGTGRVSYEAWIETLPQASRRVPLAVAPGDSVTVSISQQSAGNWLVSLTNNTTGQKYQQNMPYDSSLSTAEWIEEAPSVGRRGVVPLDDFGSIPFTNASAVKDGQTVTIAQAGARPITMVGIVGAGRQTLAQPSALGADGASFTVDRVAGAPAVSAAPNDQPAPANPTV